VFVNDDIDKVLIIVFFTFWLYYDKNDIFSIYTICKNLEVKVKLTILITISIIIIVVKIEIITTTFEF